MIEFFKHLKEYFFPTYKVGCTDEKDINDFNVGIFGFGDYKPLNQKKVNPTLSVKNQTQNNCVFNAAIVAKEPDENIALSVRKLTTYANRKGYTSGNGFSSLQNGQKCLRDYGAEADMGNDEQERDWTKYISVALDNIAAAVHKTQSYWSVSTRNDKLKYLDAGRILHTGCDWFTGFNFLPAPYIIDKNNGVKVGGHSWDIIGYDLNYNGKKVYICQNSFGKDWGDNGKFYADMDWFDHNGYSCYLNLDIVPDFGVFLNKYDGKNVKGTGATIYLIQAGQKKVYPNWATYLSFNGLNKGFIQLADDDLAMLDKITQGDDMDIKKSDYWFQLSDLQKADDQQNDLINALMNLIYKL
jgi:hypothetical protein